MDNQLMSLLILIVFGCILYLLVTRTAPPSTAPTDIAAQLAALHAKVDELKQQHPELAQPKWMDELQEETQRLREHMKVLEREDAEPEAAEPETAELEPGEPSARRLPYNEKYRPPIIDHMTHRAPTTSVLARVWPSIKEWLAGARAIHPDADPLLTAEQTRESRVVLTALAEHGTIIEQAIFETLRGSPDHVAWQEPAFRVSYMAAHTQKAGTVEGCQLAELPYGDGTEDNRKIQVDLITYDKRDNTIRAYEIKRRSDPSATSAANLAHVQMLLRSYARTKTINGEQLNPVKAETYLICYYSDANVTGKLTRDQLDKHFGVPVVAQVEEATAKFRGELQDLIATPAEQRAAA